MNELIERALRAEATRAELERLRSWLRESPDNERDYAQIARLLEATRALPRVAAAPPPTAAELLAIRPGTQTPRAERRAGVAGAIESVAAYPAARSRTGQRAARGSRGAPAWLPWGIAAVAVLALLVARGEPVSVPGHSRPMVVRTGPAELSTIQLEHGSVVRLGPASRLRIMPSSGAREVTLEGRAFFDIVQVPGRPFRVHTPLGEASVLGTRFEVRTGGDRLELVVVEGRVALAAGGQSVQVTDGEVGRIVQGELLEPRRLADADSVLSWAGRFLVFRATPLRDAVRELERAYGMRITITDREIAARTVTSTFFDQTAAEVLAVLCAIVDARCDVRPGAATISPSSGS